MDFFTMLGGRTFALTAGCGATVSVMRWFDHLDNGSYTAIVLASVCAYIAKTTVERHGEIRADVQKTLGGLQAETPPPGGVVDQVRT